MNVVTKLRLAALCSLTGVSVGLAQSAPAAPEQQAQMDAFLKGARFDAMAARTAAERIEMTSSMIPEVFTFDTRKFHVMTRALDGIWTNMADFQQKARDLHQAAVNLDVAAKSGDANATHQAAIAVGKACGACHDQFRSQ